MSFTPSGASDIIKIGFVLSVAVSFPLVIFPCRASLYSLLFRRVCKFIFILISRKGISNVEVNGEMVLDKYEEC